MAESQQPQQGDVTILEEAKTLLVQGKRFMALEDFQSATDCLEQSCRLFDAFYGVAKRECADAYLEYGLALVALANLEAGSGTDKLMKRAGVEEDGEEDEEDEDDEGDDDEEGGEDEEEEVKSSDDDKKETKTNLDEDSKPNNHTTENGDSSKKNEDTPMQTDDSTTKQTNGHAHTNGDQPQPSSSSGVEPTPGTSGDGPTEGTGEETDEEATTIEVAWEVLCLAKRLYMTDESLEGRLKLAETLQKIGEISIEWDNNDNAVSILEECLKIRLAILNPDDRLIALTYYNLGLAHSFLSQTQQANENFQNAINVIEKRISSLSADLEKAEENQDTVAIGTYQKEINELKELLPDMKMRLDDSKEDNTKTTEVLKRTREEMLQEDEEAKKMCADKSKPVDDISHLVKRKAT